jgi:HTH-type transcriptional regulator / antitoxin HigA
MEKLKYKVIKTKKQYKNYCDTLEALTDDAKKSRSFQDEIELLTLLIEKYDEEHNTINDSDPIELLKYLMYEHKMKAVDLAKLLRVSKGLVSDILHYKKGLSKETIRILSERFKLNQDVFNRPYKLKPAENARLKNASVMNTKKKLFPALK